MTTTKYVVDAIGQRICRGDTVVTLVNSSAAAFADSGVVLGAGRPGPKLITRCVDGSKVAVDATNVRVADRSYMQPGMVVASSSTEDGGGQLGLVMCAATELDLARLADRNGNGEDESTAPVVVAKGVSPAEVRRAGGEFCVGDYVVSAAVGGWLGRVVEVCLDVDVVFDDGAKCRVAWGQTDELSTTAAAATVKKEGSKNKDFYPGQRVGAPPSILKASRWLKGYWKPNHGEGTVSRVETTVVLVYWVASSSSSQLDAGEDSAMTAPANLQSPRDLTFLCPGKLLECSYWGVGDRCLFRGVAPVASSSAGGDSDHHPRQQLSAAHREWRRLWRQRRPNRRRRSLVDDDPERRPLAVASTRTTVDVLWQDGTRQRGVPSTSLVVVAKRETTVHELFPGQHVVRRTPATTAPPEPPEEEVCVGIVRGYSYKDQTVRVSWDRSESDEETLSVYHVSRCYYYFPGEDNISGSLHYGDIVVRRRQLPTPTVTDSPLSPSTSTSASADDLSWVGQYVYSECDDSEEARYIYIKWGDGNTSKVLFHEITINDRSVDDLRNELGEWVDEDGDMNNAIDEAQQKVDADDNNMNGEDDESDDRSGSDSDSEDSATAMTRMNRTRVIIQAVSQLAGKVFAQGRIYLKSGFMEAEASKTELTATGSTTASAQVLGADGDVKNTSTMKAGINGDGGNSGDKVEADTTAAGYDKPFHLPQFEIVQQSPSDHHYLDNVQQGTAGGRKWTKRVQKEWKILENNLPDTIYVRVFEDRMDLVRAVMVGASGTPYHDGLFFFDLQLPPSTYPSEPPLVNYRSFGLDVNPNLYRSGTVCLSLLNTFGAQHESELWSPEASTVLQIVVSIQGLVLTAMPYYNEPSWAPAGTTIGQRSELPYNETTFLQSLQTMLHLLRRPPVGFEEFVRDHFRRRGQRVIRACEAYRDGCLVGTLDEEGNPVEGSEKRPCSAGLRIALLNVLPRLVEAFASIQAQGC